MATASRTSSMEAQSGSVYSNTSHQARGSSAALDIHVALNPSIHPSLPQGQLIASNVIINGYHHMNGTGGQNHEPVRNGNIAHYDTMHQTTNSPRQYSLSRTAEYFASNGLDTQPGPYAPEIILEDDEEGAHHQITHSSTHTLIAHPQQATSEIQRNRYRETTIQQSLPTQTWSRTYSPSERLRLGLPRYASDEERRRAAERAAAHYHSAHYT